MCLFFNYRNSKEQHITILTFWLHFCLFRSEIFLIFTTTAGIQSKVLFEKFWQLVLHSKPTSRIILGFIRVQGIFRSPDSSEIQSGI